MASSSLVKRSSWIVFLFLFLACSVFSPQQASSPTASEPTLTQPPTAITTGTPAPTSAQTPLPLVTVDGLRMAYIRKGQYDFMGNLYVQDSGGQPVQLTNSGLDRSPLFSDDGQRIVFYRGDASRPPKNPPNSLYSIHADGSREQALVTSDLLAALGTEYDEYTEPVHLVFVPGTHQLLFSTHQNRRKQLYDYSQPNYDLLLVDTDNAKIKRLRAPGQAYGFQVSPDGQLIAIHAKTWFTFTGTTPGSLSATLVPITTPDINTNYAADYIDVTDIDGQVIRHNLVSSSPVLPDVYHDELPAFWTRDSSQLIVVPPIPTSEIPNNIGDPVLRTVWRYSLDGRPGVRIRLEPPIVGDSYSVSPDGNWIVYSYYIGDASKEKWDPALTSGVYLGNLHDGTSQLLTTTGDLPPGNYWSPDSVHFIIQNELGQIMGNVNGKAATLLRGGALSGWIDDNRYLSLYAYGIVAMGEVDQDMVVRVVEFPTGLALNEFQSFTFVFLKH